MYLQEWAEDVLALPRKEREGEMAPAAPQILQRTDVVNQGPEVSEYVDEDARPGWARDAYSLFGGAKTRLLPVATNLAPIAPLARKTKTVTFTRSRQPSFSRHRPVTTSPRRARGIFADNIPHAPTRRRRDLHESGAGSTRRRGFRMPDARDETSRAPRAL